MSSVPITVTDVTASLDVPPAVDAYSDIMVTWTGPGYRRDIIVIAPAGSPDRKYGTSVRVQEISPIRLKSPKQPGSYEIRYLMGKTRRVLARIPVTVR